MFTKESSFKNNSKFWWFCSQVSQKYVLEGSMKQQHKQNNNSQYHMQIYGVPLKGSFARENNQ